ncbi:MAG: lytic transglycosylase domain-containing protein [Sphingobacteriales bacterium]|nr:MAG: lytic transglycosylase domain-containing protein [Sphingobacteriales bacterium]
MKKNKIIIASTTLLLATILMSSNNASTKIFKYFNLGSNKELTTGIESLHIQAPKLPSSISFAGEQVPLNDWEVRERLDRELVVNCNLHSSTIFLIKKANRFFPTIEKILAENNIPDDFKYLCMAESGLDNVVSPSGASGFWQFMRGTAPSYGLFISTEIDERYNLEKATLAACKYLLEAKNTTGSWAAAAAGYNMGIVGIQNQINKQGSSNYYDLYLNSETSRYLSRIIALKTIYENQNNYGFYLDKDDLYPVLATKEIEVNGSEDWYNFAKNNNTSYKMIRKLNPWIREPKLINKEKRTYFVSIPK